jgi:MerR family transcriptional regulator, light-induced transcriptional regulator
MPGELHTLPMIALSAALAGRGVPCRSLGGNLPVAALAAAIARTAPAAVVLWSQIAGSADVEALGALPRTRPRFRTFVAGPGWVGVALPARVVRLDSLVGAREMIGTAVPV